MTSFPKPSTRCKSGTRTFVSGMNGSNGFSFTHVGNDVSDGVSEVVVVVVVVIDRGQVLGVLFRDKAHRSGASIRWLKQTRLEKVNGIYF